MKFKLIIITLVFSFFGVMNNALAESKPMKNTEIADMASQFIKKIDAQDVTKINNILETSMQTLRRGAKGTDVSLLQEKLRDMGYYTKSIDGDYGSGTKQAVMKFQEIHGLSADGVVGPKTFQKIISLVSDNGGIVACTMEYSPVCGQQTINCVKAPCPQPEPKTFGNKCAMNAAGANYLYSGECKKTNDDSEDEMDEITPCTKEYKPVCGERKPLPYEKVSQEGLMKTYSNKCVLKNADAKFLYEGTCKKQLDEQDQEDIEAKIEKIEKQLKELQDLLAILKKQK
jgi:hypothetical protein